MSVGRAAAGGGVALAGGWGLTPAPSALAAGAPSTRAGGACGGGSATVVGTDLGEVLRGTAGPDVIVGLGGNDTLVGLGGRDRLCGGLGADRLLGGPGDDVLRGERDWLHVTDEGSTERLGDNLVGDGGDDRLTPGRDVRRADDVIHDTISWEMASHGVKVDTATGVATGQGRDRFDPRGAWVVGSNHADRISGSSRDDLLSSGQGSDDVRGLGGDDRIVVDPSGAGGGRALALGGRGDDTISAKGGEDVLRGGPGDDVIDDLGPAADRLYGGAGADRL